LPWFPPALSVHASGAGVIGEKMKSVVPGSGSAGISAKVFSECLPRGLSRLCDSNIILSRRRNRMNLTAESCHTRCKIIGDQ
ncbi:MAG TPA: hypothetical protein VFT21_04090, partial [Gemmatimonadaceae bacterium]|nr:hypothetical protein [Gemmatimonadaceae bacterium]